MTTRYWPFLKYNKIRITADIRKYIHSMNGEITVYPSDEGFIRAITLNSGNLGSNDRITIDIYEYSEFPYTHEKYDKLFVPFFKILKKLAKEDLFRTKIKKEFIKNYISPTLLKDELNKIIDNDR